MGMFRLRVAFILFAFTLVAAIATVSGLPEASAETPQEGERQATSAWFQLEGGQKLDVFRGDAITQVQLKADGTCEAMPAFKVGMSGDVQAVRVALNEDCSIVIDDIVLNPEASELESGNVLAAAGWKWEVRSIGEFQGLHPVNETLTQSTASVKFKTASLTGGGPVYDGDNPWHDCFARYGLGVFRWIEDSCTHSGYDLSGPYAIWSETVGTFHHENFGWHHSIEAKASGLGWQSGVNMFSSECSNDGGPPWPAHFECELWWNLIGWQ